MPRDRPIKRILLCVAGGTPQIITETLWALINERHEQVDEVRVITTLEGARILKERLFDNGRFKQFCDDFPQARAIRFDPNSLYILTDKETGVPSPRDTDEERLKDILTREDNAKAANQICEIVKELSQDQDTIIHATVAGGRKTMGIYLTAAMQLYGRAPDALSHVLVSPEVEGNPNFYYKPPASQPFTLRNGEQVMTDDLQIYLADIPFIRLGGAGSKLLADPVSTYEAVVVEAQERLRFLESAYSLSFNTKAKKIIVANRQVRLSEREFFVYALFAYFRKHRLGAEGFLHYDRIEREHLDAVCRLISAARGSELTFDEYAKRTPRGEYLYRLDFQTAWEKVRNSGIYNPPKEEYAREDIKKEFREIRGKINRKLEDAGLPAEYLIDKRGAHFEGSFGLNVDPKRIVLPQIA